MGQKVTVDAEDYISIHPLHLQLCYRPGGNQYSPDIPKHRRHLWVVASSFLGESFVKKAMEPADIETRNETVLLSYHDWNKSPTPEQHNNAPLPPRTLSWPYLCLACFIEEW